MNVASGNLTFLAGVTGSGSFTTGSATTLGFNASVGSGGVVNLGANSTLSLSATAGFGDTISGFAGGDILNLQGIGWNSTTSFTFNGGTDKLSVTNGSSSVTLQLAGSYTSSNFVLFNNAGTTAVAHS